MATSNPQKICVAIPAYNEALVIGPVIESLVNNGYKVVVVDDCSSDDTHAICLSYPIDVLHHPINLGYGAAQQTGINWASKQDDIEVIVTFDADGQHLAEEIPSLVSPILNGEVDIVLGSRFLGVQSEEMPKAKRYLLKLAVLFTRITTGLKLTDAHNGMRAFSKKAADTLNLSQTGMAYASELLSWLAKSGFRWKEVPVKVRYTDYSKKKGQAMTNSLNILWDLLFS